MAAMVMMSKRQLLVMFALTGFSTLVSSETLEGRVISIVDGDTLTLQTADQNHRVRLSEIDTPERDQPWGSEAKAALVFKVENALVKVTVVDTDRYGRKVGKIWLDGRDINRELVREGHAWVYERYLSDKTLRHDQKLAKSEHQGLWGSTDPEPPWQWRAR